MELLQDDCDISDLSDYTITEDNTTVTNIDTTILDNETSVTENNNNNTFITENKDEFICSICNKKYTSRKNLLEHNRNIHNNYIKNINKKKDKVKNVYNCEFCNASYKYYQTRWKHEKQCKIVKEREKERIAVLEEQNKILLLEKELAKEREQILKNKLKKAKESTQSFKTLNQRLKTHNINNTNIINSTINSNNVTNNYSFIQLGYEDIHDILPTKTHMMHILKFKQGALYKLIDKIHCGDNYKYNNILLTNLKGDFIHKFIQKEGCFMPFKKDKILDDILEYRLTDLEEMIECCNPAIDIKNDVNKSIDKIKDLTKKVYDIDGTVYKNFKTCIFEKITLSLFNNQYKIIDYINNLLQLDENYEL